VTRTRESEKAFVVSRENWRRNFSTNFSDDTRINDILGLKFRTMQDRRGPGTVEIDLTKAVRRDIGYRILGLYLDCTAIF